jgi:hypothetical protein
MKALFLIIFTSATVAVGVAAASPLTPGNVLISDPFFLGRSVIEYQPDGTLVQTIQVPQPTYGGSAGGITFDGQGLLWLYNGDFQPYLSSWDSHQDIWMHRSCPGWNSYLCFPCQGIGTFGNFVFVTDEGSSGDPNGLVRFDHRDTNCVRFAEGRNYSALAVGLDGVVYARRADDIDPPPPTVIDAFDPATLGPIRTVTLSDSSLTIAADALGQLYGANGQSILRYSANGTLIGAHQVITNGALYTLAISRDGRFVVVSSNGEVVIADSKFVPLNRFVILTGSQAYAAIIPDVLRLFIRCSQADCSQFELCWNSRSNGMYQVQYSAVLTANVWTNLGAPVPGNGTTNCTTDAITIGQLQRYYRVEELP